MSHEYCNQTQLDLQREIDRLRAALATAQAERDAALAERDHERLRYDGMRSDRDDWRKRCEDAQQQIATLTEQRDAALAERDAIMAVLSGIQGALTDAGDVPVPGFDLALAEAVRGVVAQREAERQAVADVSAERDIAQESARALAVSVVRATTERDAALAERDAARNDVERFRQSMYATEESSANQYQRAERAETALTEARRVLREVEWCGGSADCPCCKEWDTMGHKADCALAAVLAQEER